VREWAREVTFPDGLHRHRRIGDVALHDGIHPDGVYILNRARRPRATWDRDVVIATRIVAIDLEEGRL
jgi:hypothetical protein